MATYYTARDDAGAPQQSEDEQLSSPITASGGEFRVLIELVWGKSVNDLPDAEQRWVETSVEGLARVGDRLAGEIADRDQDELQDLATPWAELVPQLKAADLVDFLTDLQHLSRHAKAEGLHVYSLELR
ncbi:hypothetical protein JOF29_006133 [Kribbella aluminosa]|uniref:Uncharacterized protein n=1 Tax=Kribbella aluminosa TaxID=416017 RepID=A0ABS4UTQ9_9ACTN|nr:hypothetical protein [Kribbella aluminosa]MBP2355023.1 hypothetical protein [Kribbella aluminosa]